MGEMTEARTKLLEKPGPAETKANVVEQHGDAYDLPGGSGDRVKRDLKSENREISISDPG